MLHQSTAAIQAQMTHTFSARKAWLSARFSRCVRATCALSADSAWYSALAASVLTTETASCTAVSAAFTSSDAPATCVCHPRNSVSWVAPRFTLSAKQALMYTTTTTYKLPRRCLGGPRTTVNSQHALCREVQ